MNWGWRVEFCSDNKVVDAYSTKCGNDGSIHNTSGVWYFNNQTSILRTSIPLYLLGKYSKVLSVTSSELVLLEIKEE